MCLPVGQIYVSSLYIDLYGQGWTDQKRMEVHNQTICAGYVARTLLLGGAPNILKEKEVVEWFR